MTTTEHIPPLSERWSGCDYIVTAVIRTVEGYLGRDVNHDDIRDLVNGLEGWPIRDQ